MPTARIAWRAAGNSGVLGIYDMLAKVWVPKIN